MCVKHFLTSSISASTPISQFHTVVVVAARRTEFGGEPRLANAARYLFSSYATRSCQQRITMRIHLKARARTAARQRTPGSTPNLRRTVESTAAACSRAACNPSRIACSACCSRLGSSSRALSTALTHSNMARIRGRSVGPP